MVPATERPTRIELVSRMRSRRSQVVAMLGFFLLVLTACGGGAEPFLMPATDDGQSPSITQPEIQVEFALDGTTVLTPTTEADVVEPTGTVVAHATVSELTAYAKPSTNAAEVAALANPTPYGSDLVVRVVDRISFPAPEWVEVQLPVRPNGTTGFVRSEDVEFFVSDYRIEIDTSDFRLDVYKSDEQILTTTIGVGTGDTPTPYGEFYLAELFKPPSPDGAYGPFAFGLSGFSDVLESFAGGDAVIGIHGTNRPAALGTEVSHGCVRVHNDVITELAAKLPLGSPVVIKP